MRCQHCDHNWDFTEESDAGTCTDCHQALLECPKCGEFTVDADDPADYCDCLKEAAENDTFE